jgi:hypothetical protein
MEVKAPKMASNEELSRKPEPMVKPEIVSNKPLTNEPPTTELEMESRKLRQAEENFLNDNSGDAGSDEPFVYGEVTTAKPPKKENTKDTNAQPLLDVTNLKLESASSCVNGASHSDTHDEESENAIARAADTETGPQIPISLKLDRYLDNVKSKLNIHAKPFYPRGLNPHAPVFVPSTAA